MAKKQPRPGRVLIWLMVAIVVLCGLASLGGSWAPHLGLDLQGGTRITLVAAQQNPNENQLREAASIIDQRVNGSGVAEAEVSVQGNRNIIVEIPGKNRKDLVDSVKRTAQLRFRLVAQCGQNACILPGSEKAQAQAKKAQQKAGASPSPSASASPAGPSGASKPKRTATPKPRTAPDVDLPAAPTKPTPGPKSKKQKSGPTASPQPSPSPTANPATASGAPVDQPLKWQFNPGARWVKKFVDFTCTRTSAETAAADRPDQPLIACGKDGNKYLLSKAVIQGTDLKSASFGIPQNSTDWAVMLKLKGGATETFANISQKLVGNGGRFAIVLDGVVLTAPGFDGVISDGNAQITGSFTQASASSLANSLKYGALPLRFPDPSVEQIGATLAGDQLSAGLIAGGIGLALVMGYCLLYYRGLGLVVIASLVVAALITYASVLLLSHIAGFTLTLPGIAGLIVAVGITADSFIVYFERIRDEMRAGRSMRVAVESGWAKARNTCLAADAVSFLAALVLYIFAIGVVKGFAFALGISTVIDVAVFFWFTKPTMTLLARRRFFNSGRPLSGLSRETLGLDGPAPVGGRL